MPLLPALRDAIREIREGFGSDPICLNLKGLTYDATNIDWYARNGYRELYSAWGAGLPAWSGESVSEATALNHSVVWACTRVIAESAAMLPLSLFERRADGRYPLPSHPLYAALHDEPNEQSSAMEFRETLTAQCVLRGNAYAKIVRRSSTGAALRLYMLDNVRVDRDSSGALVYVVKEGGGAEQSFTVADDKPHDILHLRGLGFNGLVGQSVIAAARQSIGTALSAERYAATFYAAGGRVPYVIEMAQKFRTEQDFQRWRADWNQFYANRENWHQAVALEPGMTYKQIGLSPEDSQFLESRQFSIPEVCRWFLMSPHMVGDLSRATFSNIEHLFLEFLTRTLNAWLVRWEQAIHRCCLTPDEKTRLYAKHNVNALLRGDFKSRMEGYSAALQNAIFSVDDVLDLEDRNPLPDGAGKARHLQLNMQTLPGTGGPMAAEKNAAQKEPSQEPKSAAARLVIGQDRPALKVIRDDKGRLAEVRYAESFSIDRDSRGKIAGVTPHGA